MHWLVLQLTRLPEIIYRLVYATVNGTLLVWWQQYCTDDNYRVRYVI